MNHDQEGNESKNGKKSIEKKTRIKEKKIVDFMNEYYYLVEKMKEKIYKTCIVKCTLIFDTFFVIAKGDTLVKLRRLDAHHHYSLLFLCVCSSSSYF